MRVVAATNRKPSEAARAGEFRDDLFYRLAVIRVMVPTLRERAEDILPIATAMLRRLKNDPEATIPADFGSMLNVVERYVVFGVGEDLFMETKTQARAAELLSHDRARAPGFHEEVGVKKAGYFARTRTSMRRPTLSAKNAFPSLPAKLPPMAKTSPCSPSCT